MTRLQVFDWSRKREGDRVIIELEGKTKRMLCSLPIGSEVDLELIPDFQGTTQRVRITVELIPSKGDT